MKKQNKKHDIDKWPIPACLFIGMGIGFIIKQIWGPVLIGLGVGLLIVYLTSKKKK